MRVIGGTARSVPLYEVEADTTRSMTDRVKTSLFSIIDLRLPGASVADLFAGTGGLGIEALSRGADHCTFVERDRACVGIIEKNLNRTRLADGALVLGVDAWRGAGDMAESGRTFDLVFLDPPFRLGLPPERSSLIELARVAADRLLVSGGMLVYHHELGAIGDLETDGLTLSDRREYGRNVITFFIRD
jgi:16S rRNA (guanine966-N2)-methyltransferase